MYRYYKIVFTIDVAGQIVGTGRECLTIKGLMMQRKLPQIRNWPFVFTTLTMDVAESNDVTFGLILSTIPNRLKAPSNFTCLSLCSDYTWMLT